MDVVLFNPAPRSGWQVQRRIELPLSLLCPASALDRAGYRVRIIEEFDNRHWRGELLEAIREPPICFGVTSMTGPQILHALAACAIVRRQQPGTPIVWGGIHATLLPEQTLEHPLADIVVVGEGEETLLELVKALQTGGSLETVPGLAYKDEQGIHRTPRRPYVDMDRQEPLNYRLVNMDQYRLSQFDRDHISFNSSRGCPHRCRFYWDPVMHGRTWRAMRPETVMAQVRRIVEEYDIRGFLFTDDNFCTDLERARGILEAIVRSGLDLSISKLQIRADTICRLDEDMFRLMKRAGVKRLSVGIETGSPRLLEELAKDITVEHVLKANDRLKAYPIVPMFLFMMGLPSETPDELSQSIALATRLTDENPNATKNFNIFTPYPGTELFARVVEMGWKPPGDLESWAHLSFRRLADSTPWIKKDMRRLIDGLDFPLMFLGKSHFVSPYKVNRVVVALARVYYPLARYRVTHMDVRWPLDTLAVRALGLLGRKV